MSAVHIHITTDLAALTLTLDEADLLFRIARTPVPTGPVHTIASGRHTSPGLATVMHRDLAPKSVPIRRLEAQWEGSVLYLSARIGTTGQVLEVAGRHGYTPQQAAALVAPLALPLLIAQEVK